MFCCQMLLMSLQTQSFVRALLLSISASQPDTYTTDQVFEPEKMYTKICSRNHAEDILTEESVGLLAGAPG